jgi:L,D-transpeptidase ErfK/SrfK
MLFFNFYRQCPDGTTPYVIKPGDTMGRIAALYNTTIQAIINVNTDIEINNLQIGQQICIPLRQQEYPACPTTNYYVLKSGDTLASVAEYFGVTLEELLEANLGVEPGEVYEDMYLCIPLAPSPVTVSISIGNRVLTVYRNGSVFRTYPVAVGRPATPTPRGRFTILYKEVDPQQGFGVRLLGLSLPNYAIYGTENVASIGNEVTNGDIVMTNENIEEFFNLVPVETVVTVS